MDIFTEQARCQYNVMKSMTNVCVSLMKNEKKDSEAFKKQKDLYDELNDKMSELRKIFIFEL